MSSKTVGNKGERIAVKWLVDKGYTILTTNYFSPYGEIDIIAKKDEIIYFVEVKTRLNTTFGNPIDSLTKTKQMRIQKTVYIYLEKSAVRYKDFKISFIGIQKKTNGKLQLTYIADVLN